MVKRVPAQGFAGWVLLLTALGLGLIDGAHQWIYQQSALTPLLDWLRGHATDDSWRHMQKAYDAWRAPRNEALYQVLFFQDRVKFQYPLSSLLPLHFAELLGIKLGTARLNKLSHMAVLLQVVAVAQVALLAFKARHAEAVKTGALVGVWVAAALACLLFYPVLKAYSLGQVQTWLNAWFSLACLAWMLNRPVWAGVLVGLVCLFKPQFALFLPWALLRRQWHFAAGWGGVVLIGVALSVGFFGLRDNLDYLSVLSYMSRHGEAYYPNQSVNGLMNRLLGNGDSSQWPEHGFPPYHAVVHAATLLSSAALVLGTLLYRWRARRFSVADVLIAALSFTMASPIAWEHHYGVMAAAFPVLAALALDVESPARRKSTLAVLAVSYLLCSRFWPSAQALAPSWANVAQSYLFLGSLVVLGLLYRLRDRAAGGLGAEAPGASPTLRAGRPAY